MGQQKMSGNFWALSLEWQIFSGELQGAAKFGDRKAAILHWPVVQVFF